MGFGYEQYSVNDESSGSTPQTKRFCEKHKCLINTIPF